MSQQGKKHKDIRQIGRDFTQVGGDYLKLIQINFLSGNWQSLLFNLLPLAIVICLIGGGIHSTINNLKNLSQGFSSNQTLTQGSVTFLNSSSDSKVYISAYRAGTFINASNIPFSDYQNSLIQLNQNSPANGTINLYSSSEGNRSYTTTIKGTDINIKLKANPMKKGEVVKGEIKGTLTDGINRKEVLLRFVVPVS